MELSWRLLCIVPFGQYIIITPNKKTGHNLKQHRSLTVATSSITGLATLRLVSLNGLVWVRPFPSRDIRKPSYKQLLSP